MAVAESPVRFVMETGDVAEAMVMNGGASARGKGDFQFHRVPGRGTDDVDIPALFHFRRSVIGGGVRRDQAGKLGWLGPADSGGAHAAMQWDGSVTAGIILTTSA